MELHLLNASLKSKESFALIQQYISAKTYTREFQILIGKISEYYDRDPNADHVVKEVLLGILEAGIQNKKHLENFTNIINEAEGSDTSVANIQELILKAKLNEVGTELSVALINNDPKVKDLLDKYRELSHYTTLDELSMKGVTVITVDMANDILRRAVNREGTMKLYPLALNERVDGLAAGGHHIVTFARPEMGKTALNITLACGFARQGFFGIYIINEDREEDIYLRMICNLSGLTRYEAEADINKAIAIAKKNGLDNIMLVGMAPGTPDQVEAFADRYRPRWMVMDQLRNLQMKEANKVLQLEYATSAMRNIGKRYNGLMVSSTQAGDSGEGKKLLTMGDVDFSNTGVAAQADVLLGIGGDPTDVQEGRRILNLSKNKLANRHENFPVKIIPALSRYVSYRGDGNE